MVLAGGVGGDYGGAGGAVYLSIGDGSMTSNTDLTLTDCIMINNTAGL